MKDGHHLLDTSTPPRDVDPQVCSFVSSERAGNLSGGVGWSLSGGVGWDECLTLDNSVSADSDHRSQSDDMTSLPEKTRSDGLFTLSFSLSLHEHTLACVFFQTLCFYNSGVD